MSSFSNAGTLSSVFNIEENVVHAFTEGQKLVIVTPHGVITAAPPKTVKSQQNTIEGSLSISNRTCQGLEDDEIVALVKSTPKFGGGRFIGVNNRGNMLTFGTETSTTCKVGCVIVYSLCTSFPSYFHFNSRNP